MLSASTTGWEGLTSAEAAIRLLDGPNALPAAEHQHALVRQLVHFFAVVLWVADVLALVAGMLALAAAIAVVVVLNGVFAFAREYRAAQNLRDLLPLKAKVLRGDRPVVVDATDLVVDDAVLLTPGDRSARPQRWSTSRVWRWTSPC